MNEPGNPLKAIGYVRQSRGRNGEDEDSSLSLSQQEETIREWSKRNNYTIVGIVKDFDETGRTMDRPGFVALREAVRPGMTVVTYKYDRFARNLIGQELAVDELETFGVDVRSITEPPGKLPRQLLGSIAEYYSDQLSERLTAIRASAAKGGRYTAAKPAFGYRRSKVDIATDPTTGATKTHRSGPIELDPERAPLMVEAFTRVADGESLTSILLDLRTRGYFHGSNAHVLTRMIQNPVYYGAVRYRGAIVATGTHPAIVSEAQWLLANERMANRPNVRRKAIAHWAEGLVYHVCGRRMYLDDIPSPPHPRDGTRTHYLYYRCVATSRLDSCGIPLRTYSVRKFDRAIVDCLTRCLETVASLPTALAHATARAGGIDIDRQRQLLDKQRTAAEKRREKARGEYLSGDDDVNAWEAEKRRHKAEIDRIDAEVTSLPSAPDLDRYTAIADLINHAVETIALTTDAPALRRIVETLGVVVVSVDGMTIRFHEDVADFSPGA